MKNNFRNLLVGNSILHAPVLKSSEIGGEKQVVSYTNMVAGDLFTAKEFHGLETLSSRILENHKALGVSSFIVDFAKNYVEEHNLYNFFENRDSIVLTSSQCHTITSAVVQKLNLEITAGKQCPQTILEMYEIESDSHNRTKTAYYARYLLLEKIEQKIRENCVPPSLVVDALLKKLNLGKKFLSAIRSTKFRGKLTEPRRLRSESNLPKPLNTRKAMKSFRKEKAEAEKRALVKQFFSKSQESSESHGKGQKRSKWTDEETTLLVESFIEHGNNWRLIAKAFKGSRSNVNCKDRMRNISHGSSYADAAAKWMKSHNKDH